MSSVRVRYETIEFGEHTDIHVRALRDRNEFADADGEAASHGISSAVWPIFGIVWDAGRVLAELMFRADIDGRSVLEVGCGIGLASLVLNHREADVTATDRHPEAGRFLAENAELNGGPPIPFVRAAWSEPDCGLGRYDLIIGSDLLYEETQIGPLVTFLDRHAKPTCEVVVVDPGRRYRGRFEKAMAAQGFRHHRTKPDFELDGERAFKGEVLWCERDA